MTINIFRKQPAEIIPVSVDFENVLETEEIISSLSAIAYDSAGLVVTSTIINATSIVSPKCYVTVKSGISGAKYKITFIATTNLGNVYEEDVFMSVKAV